MTTVLAPRCGIYLVTFMNDMMPYTMDPTRKAGKMNNRHAVRDWIKYGRVKNGFEIRHNEYNRTLGPEHALMIPVATFHDEQIDDAEKIIGEAMKELEIKAKGNNEYINVNQMKDMRIGIDDLIRGIKYVAKEAQRLQEQGINWLDRRNDIVRTLKGICTGQEGN